MQIIVSSNILKENLNELNGVISGNTVLPILEDFLFEVEGDNLLVTGSDVETRIKVSIPIQVSDNEKSKNVAFCIPSKILVEYLKNLPDQPLNISYNENESFIELISNTGRYKIGTEPANEYPKATEKDIQSAFEISSSQLKESINKTLFATSNDTLRPAMTGVLFEIKSGDLFIVATDAHRLIKLTIHALNLPDNNALIIPKKPLQLLKNILPNQDEIVKIGFNNSHVFVEQGTLLLSSRLIDAKFPPYNAVIPSDNPYTLKVNREELSNCLRRVSVFASKGTSQVVFDIVGNDLKISAQDLDFSYEGNEQLTCNYNGEEMKIAFNAKLLIEMLNILDTENVVIELSMPSRAGIFKNEQSDSNESEELLMLLMPLIVNI